MKQGIKNKKHAIQTALNPEGPEHNHNYGTSKLEQDFAKEFLDKYGVNYQYQFHAKDIGRYYDFFLPDKNILIEVDGNYWHGDTDKYKHLNNMQKKAHVVDEIKDRWAHIHGIPIVRIWESDIRKNTPKVMQILRENRII